jgi:hypothetical protein
MVYEYIFHIYNTYIRVEEERLFLKPKKLVTVEVSTTAWTGGTSLLTLSVDFAFGPTASMNPCICP